MSEIDDFYVHTATVETYQGNGTYGDTWLPQVAVPCFADDGQDVTVNGTTVAVTDQTKLYADLAYAPDTVPTAGQFAANSKVTVNGQVARVVSVKRHSSADLGLPDHVEVTIK